MKNTLEDKKKSKIEFSKVLTVAIVIIVGAIGVWSIIKYYLLIELAIINDSSVLPDVSLPVACITTILGALLSYALYQGSLKISLNRNKLTIDDGIVKPIYDKFLEDDDEEEQ